MSIQPWKRVEPTTVTKVGHRIITNKRFEMPDGHIDDWTVMHEDGWAAACGIALTPDNKVIIVRQYRPGPEEILDEIPGGIMDEAGETPEQCLVREFTEETGYKPGNIEYLGAGYTDSYVNGKRHYFLLTNCVAGSGGPDDDSNAPVEVVLVSIDEFLQNAKKGLMTDPGAVVMAYDKLMALKEGK